ncbi:hypothetical protein ABPG77_007786 [Micractinium sp. CCAP 211/92]
MAHIHYGAAGQANGKAVVVLLPVGGVDAADGTHPSLSQPINGSYRVDGNFTTDDLDGVAPADFKTALRTGPSAQLYVAVHTTEWPGGAIRGQLHWAASPGNDVLSVYNDLSGSAGGGGDGGTSGATRGCGGRFGLRLLALALAAAVALLV